MFSTLLISSYGLVTAKQDVVAFGRTIESAGDVSPTVVLGAAGLVVLVIFAWWKRHRTTRVGSFTLAMQFLVTAGVTFLVPVFVQTTLGYDALESGLTLLPTTVALILVASAASRLVGGGRMTRRSIIVVGFLLMAAGAIIVALTFDPNASGLRLAPGLAIAGLGLGCCAILPDLVQSSAPPDAVSDVAGLFRSCSYLGQSVGSRSRARAR